MPIETTYSQYLREASVSGARTAIAESITDIAPLRAISDADAAMRTPDGKWSRKEILGHLVDSALNNTQRFVRAQIPAHQTNGVLHQPGYAQDDWVRVGAYQARAWSEIIELWVNVNRNIVHIIDNFDAASRLTPCFIGDGGPYPAEHVIVDYAGHLVHHYRQITGVSSTFA